MCCFRQRALYEKKTCLVCRTEHDDVIFTELATNSDTKYDNLVASSRNNWDQKHGVHFTSRYVHDDTMKLLDIQCPVCSEKFANFDLASEHVKAIHNKQYCSICAIHKKAFVSELTLYTQKQLQKHLADGDSEGFTGHPKCKHCRNKRFYSEDELNVHIRDKHERCHICDQDSPHTADYFKNYDDLYQHFQGSHYVCYVPLCIEKRFVVFREDLDLTAHMLKEHGGLTGQNGRVVIGATSSQFLSQLLTFPRQNDKQEDSLDVKKRRLEERAKHYLNYNQDEYSKFTSINHSFKSKRITATQLITEYENLFKNSDRLEISLLVYELAEVYPLHSDQHKHLQTAYSSMAPSRVASPLAAESFPVLGNGLLRGLSNLTWGTGLGSRRGQDEQFPALAKPARSKTPVVKNAPIRYTVLKKPVKPAPPQVQVNSSLNASFKPTYLDSTSRAPSVSSLPVLGSGPDSGSGSSSRVQSRSQSPITHVASPSSLPDTKFPTLAKKTVKKEIPRVNPVPVTLNWGPGLAQPIAKPADDWGIPIVDKKAEKLKRKLEKKKI